MNKIFKVVWNRTIGSFVVTSELAKGRVKSSSEGAEGDVRASEEGRLKTLFRLTALSAALLGFSEGAWAGIPEGPKTNGATLAIGEGSTSANGTGSLAIGNNAQAKTNGALAIGPNSTNTTIANGNNAIAIGVNLQTTGQKAIGIGTDTTVSGTGAIAIGNNDSSRMANQGVNGNGAIGVGSNLTARGNNAIAVGTESQATANHSIAIGTGTRATGEDSIAIGRSEGTKLTRADNKQSVAIGWTAQATGATQAVAIGPDAVASGTQSTSIGNNTRATGDSSIAIGGDDWNIVRTKQVAAAGNKQVHQVYQELTGVEMKAQGEAYKNPFKGTTAGDAAVAIGVAALAEGTLSTAFGSGTSASGVGAAAFGVGATASQNKSVAIGAGSHTRTDATAVTTATVNGITYGGFAGTTHITSGSQVSFGSEGYERQLKHVAPGAITATSTDAINGSQLYALHAGSGNIAKAVADALGGGATVSTDPTNRQGTVTLPSYNVLKGSATPNMAGNGTANFNATPARSVADALTNLNTYVNQGFAVKDNSGAAKGIVTPGESVQFADGNATTVTVETEADGNTKVKYDVKVDDKTIKVVDGKLTGTSQTHFYSVKNEDQTKGNYNNDGATGDNALAAGVDASATANGTTAVGLKAQASAESAIAVGSETKAAAKNAVVIGNKASVEAATGSVASVNGTTTGEGSVAVGAASKASGTNATAVGQSANAFGQNSFAGGQASNALGKSSVALGDGANALNDSAVALGAYTNANNAGATAVGFNTNASGWASFAGGHSAKAEASSAVALGHEAQAVGSKAVAIGKSSHATKESGIALGDGAKAAEVNAIAIGSGNNAWKTDSIALGRAANADGAASLALGLNSHTRLDNAIALGNGANADHSNSIAIGTSSHAAESTAIAIGNNAQALKYRAVVIGDQAQSNNSRSVVIGYHASATNPAKPASAEDDYNQTVAIGAYANAWGDQSTAIGNNVDAKGNSSIAIGADDWDTVAVKTVDGTGGKTVKEVYQDYTGDVMVTGSYTHTTSSEAAVAIGTKSQAIGQLSTAFGTGTIAEGVASAAFGMGAKATKGNSVAIGAGSTTTTNAIEVNEATVNNLKYSGFAGGNRITSGDQVSFGSSGYERQLKNVAPGEISSTSTDAINGSQLYAVQNVLGNTAKTVKNVLGGDAAVGEDGGFTMSNIGGTGQNTIDAAIRDLKTNAYKPFKLTIAQTGGTNGVSENHTLQDVTSGSTITLEAGKNISLRQNGATVSINTVDNPEFTGKVTAKGGLDMSGNKITNVLSGTDTKDAVNLGQLQEAMANLSVSTLTTVNNDAPFSYIGADGRILRREVTVAPGTNVKTVSFKHIDDNTEYSGDVTIAALNPTDPQTTTPTTVGNVKNGAKDNDAVNVSQLNKIAEAIGTQVNPDGTITAPTYSVISGDPSTASVANYNTVGGALTALSNAVRTPLNFEGDTGTKFDRQLGSTVAVKGGQTDKTKLSDNNIGVVSDDQNHTLNVKLAKELTGLTSAAFSGDVTAAGTTVNGSGVTIGSGSNPVSLTAGGLSNGGNKVTNIADGVADTDAASFKQVKAAKTEVQGGTNVASVTKTDNPTDGHTVYTVNAKGAAVALDSSVDGLKLTSSEDTTTNVTTYKLDLSDKTKASLTKADSALQNIGVQVNGTDAKTLTKDDSTLNFVDGTGTTAENKNGTVAFNVNKSTLTAGTDGTVNAGKAGDAFATAADVAQAINEAVANSEKTSVVEKGDNTHVTAVEAGNKTTYTVHADNTTVSVKDGGKLKLESSEKANANQTKTTNYELDLTDAAKAEIQKGVDAKTAVDTKGITFNGDSGSPVTKKLDETLAIKGDDKNVVTEASADGIKVKLKDDITLTSVTAETLKAGASELTTTGLTTPKVTAGDSVLTTDGLKIGADSSPNQVSLTTAGLNNGGNKITNVAKGTEDTDGVNVSQIKPLAEALNTTVGADGSIAAPNFTVNHADGTAGTPVHTVQDALNEVGKELNKGLNIVADNGSSEKVNLGDTVTYTSKDKNIVTTSGTGKAIDFSLAEKVTIGKDAANGGKPVVIDGKEGIVSGLTNTTLGSAPLADSNKAATEAQLDATQVNLATILGGNAANNNGNVTTNNIGGTGKDNVHEAIAAVKETADKGWNLKANDETDSEKIAAGDTVTVKQGKNIRVKRSGKDLTVETSDDVEFAHVKADSVEATSVVAESVIAGNSVLNTDGLKIGADNSPNQVSLTTAGLNNGGNKITNVAKGAAETDAVNVSQLNPIAKALNTSINPTTGAIDAPVFTVTKADGTKHEAVGTVQDALDKVGEEVGKGLNIVADNGSSEKVNLGDTVTYTSKDKNIVTTSGTGKAIDFSLAEKVTIGKDAANGGKPVVIDGKEGIVSGLTNTTLGSAPLADSNKAATEAQLDATQVNLATILGGEAANNNGNVTTSNIGETGADNVHDAIKSVKETAEKGWKLKVNEETSSEKINPDDEVAIKEGKNIKVTRNGKNITVATAEDVEFNKVTVGASELTTTGLTTPKVTAGNSVLTTDGLKIGADSSPNQVSLTNAGLNNGGNKIANIAKGTEDTDGVNVSQIKPLATALNTTVGADGSIAAPNFTVNHADGTAGTPVHTVQDALNEVGKELNKGLNIAADNGNADKVNLGETVTYTSKDKNIVTTVADNEIDFSLADKITVGKAGQKPVVIDGTTGTVSGLTNTTLGGTDFATSNKAATEAQLDATQVNLKTILGGEAENNNGNVTTANIGDTGKGNIHEAIKSVKETAEKGWKLKVNEETSSEKISPDDEVTIKEGKNIKVTRNGKNITVATAEDVEFNKVTVGDSILTSAGLTTPKVTAGNSVLTTDGLKIGDDSSPNQVSLTTAGLNNGGNKIAKVAKGTDATDGVNVSQLSPIAKALNTSIDPVTGDVAAPAFTVTKADGTKHEAVGTVQDALNKVGEEVSKGLKIAADNGNEDKVNLGETVTYTSKDKNIVTTSGTGKAIDFSLAEKVTIGKDAANGGKPVVIDGKEGIVSGLTNTTLGSAPLAGSDKAATEAQLDATQVNLATILGGNAANNNGNVTTNNIGGTGKDNVHEAIAAVKETADKGWNLKANDETDSEKIAAGDTVTVKQGKNIRVKRSGKDLTVETEDDVEFAHVKADSVEATSVVAESVIAGNSVLNTDGLKIGADGSPNQVSLTTAGLNNGGNKITKVAEGTLAADSTDAVNGAQLYKVDQKANTNTENIAKGINIGGTSGSNKYALGDTVNIKGDSNITSETVEGGVQLKLADTLKIGQDSGKPVSIDGTTGTVSGLSNTTLGGADFATSNKAATEEQLNETQANLAKLLGGKAANDKGNVTTSDIGGTGKDNVHDAIAAVKETAGKGWNLKANDEADSDSENIAADDTVTVKQGKNIRVKRSGKELTIETSDDVEFGTVSATTVLADSFISGNSVLSGEGLKIGADGSPSQVSLTNAGLNNGGNKIANVAKGTADTDAVNVAQLNEQLAATEKTTTVVAGKNVTVSEKVDGNNTEYTVNADKTTLSQAAGGAVKVSEGAKDADGVTDYALDLTDEAKADIAKGVAAKDAVDNKGLTFAADNGTTGAKKLGDSLSVKGDGNILTRADENGIGFSLADKITVGKAGNGNKPLVIDGTAGLISGLSNTTLGGADFATKGQAASEEQLNAAQINLANLLGGNAANDKGNVTTADIGGTGKDNVHDAIAAVKETADKGWNLNANDETSSEKIGAGDTVTFKEGKNVKVSRNGKHITVATSDDVSFDKVTVGGSVLTDNGLTVGNGKAGKPVSLTKDGLNNGGNKVSDIAAGEADTDAVNVAQLKAAAAKATSKVDSGNDNIVVTPEQNADGSTTYKVATAPNLKADSFTAGDTVVNNDGVKVGDKVALGKDGLKAGDVNITADGINAGNKAISNVAAGVKDTDAANVGQLNRLTAAAKTEVEAGTNIASVTGKQGANGQTVYTVNADGASVSAGSDNIVVTKGNKDANNVTDYAVDLSKAVKADIAKGVTAKDAVDNKGISFAGDSGTTVANKLGDTVAVKGDANITTTAGANGIQVGLNKDLKVDSVKAGDTVVNNNGVNVGDKVALGKDGLKAGDVNITADGINAGGKKVTGVAAGTVAAGSTDAVNGGQLHQVYELIGSNGGNVNTAPPSVEADGKAGLGNIKNITLVDNSNNPNVTNVTNETKIAQSNGYSLVTYNVEDQGMYVTNNVIEAVGRMNEQGIKFFHTNDGEVNPDVQARNSEDSSASGAYATAVGFQAASKGTNAIAIGKGAKASAENTIAIGTGNIVSGKNSGAIGDPTVVSGNSSYSIGNNNNVSADNAYALGSNIKATVKDSVYLGDRAQTQGIHTADAAKGEAYTYGGLNDKAVAGKAGSAAAANKVAGVVTVGNGTDETRQVQGVAAGVVSADSTDAINGSQLYYTNQAIANVATQATAAKTEVTAGKNVVVNQTTGNSGQTVYNVATADKLDVTSVTAGGVTVNAQGVSIAAPTAHNPANTVSLSPIGLNNGGQRITNVAPAKEGTDAVNLNQLAGVGNALQNNIERVGKKAYAGVAGAIAQGSIPQVTRPGATGIGVGSGYYGGQSAMAIGVSAMSDGGNWVVKGNFSANTDGHVGVGAGALYQW